MTRLGFDLETDGFLSEMTQIHCLAVMDFDTKQQWLYEPGNIDAGIKHLQSASELIAHNGISFDFPAIKKFYPDFNTRGITVTDTLVLSRVIRANLRNEDFDKGWTLEQMPKRLYGSHSLKAWGIRLGLLKGDFGETTDWSEYSQDMGQYCQQDVVVCHALWEALAPHKWSKESIELEHSLAEICHRIGNVGWTFDTKKAGALYAKLAKERGDLEEELKELFPAWVVETPFVPKVNNKSRGYVKGEVFMKTKTVEFNPGSRKHIEFCLREKYKWKPKVFTASGDAKIDETTLNSLPYPEAKKLAHSFLLQKRIGQLAEGNQAWLKHVKDDLVTHTINSNGAVTGRATHFNFNAAQVPNSGAMYGTECRELFTVPPGFSLVGSDLSGLELRCLANFLQDNGAYAKEIFDGDIHTANMAAFGITDRNQSKRAIYCLIYGGGNAKLGEVVGGGAADGKRLRENFLKANPAFAALLRAVKNTVDAKGHLTGLDGRKLYIRSEHAALNTLLQSAGALICKKWVQLIDTKIREQDIPAVICGWVHDEVQLRVRKGAEQNVCNIATRCAEEAGEHFKFTIPITAEATVGRNWSETH